jgi:hypothetical protein
MVMVIPESPIQQKQGNDEKPCDQDGTENGEDPSRESLIGFFAYVYIHAFTIPQRNLECN